MVETGKVEMENKRESESKAIGKLMIELIEDVRVRFEERTGVKPSIIDTSNMIAKAVKKKGIYIG